MEVIERLVYTHYILKGTIVKGFILNHTHAKPLYFIKVRGEDGKTYDINIPTSSRTFDRLQNKVGKPAILKIEGYQKGGIERYAFLHADRL